MRGSILTIAALLVLGAGAGMAQTPQSPVSGAGVVVAEEPSADIPAIDRDLGARVASLVLPVLPNPGPQPDLRATRTQLKDRNPVSREYDGLNVLLQTFPRGDRAPWQQNRQDTDLSVFDRPGGGQYVLRHWAETGEASVLLARVAASGAVEAVRLVLPLGKAAFWVSDDADYAAPDAFMISELPGGDVLLMIDTRRRCSGERRLGVLVRLSGDLQTLRWISPLRSAGGGNFAFNARSVFAVDGGSCEPDFLYEMDLQTGAVRSRMRLPSGPGGGDFITLDGDRLNLVLYGHFVQYRLR